MYYLAEFEKNKPKQSKQPKQGRTKVAKMPKQSKPAKPKSKAKKAVKVAEQRVAVVQETEQDRKKKLPTMTAIDRDRTDPFKNTRRAISSGATVSREIRGWLKVPSILKSFGFGGGNK